MTAPYSLSTTLSQGFQSSLDGLIKLQTFTPVIGVIPALIALPFALIALVTAIALKTFSASAERPLHNDTLIGASLTIPYSLLNLCTLGFFAPIFEYKTHMLSSLNGQQFATAGFFDLLFPNNKERPLRFLGVPPLSTTPLKPPQSTSSDSELSSSE